MKSSLQSHDKKASKEIKKVNLRAAAAKTLAPVLKRQGSLNAHFDTSIQSLNEKERPFFQELCFGTLRHFFELEAISKLLLDKPLRNKDADIYASILLGLYQLRHLRTPDHAAIAETVQSIKTFRKPWAIKLVNAILRGYSRDKQNIESKIAKNQELAFNHPSWLVSRIKKAWPNNWQEILIANNHIAPMCLRNNVRIDKRKEYLDQLKLLNIESQACESSANAIRLKHAQDPLTLPKFSEGRISIQDEAAQLSAYLLDLKPQQRVLDACCAPGGKTCHILENEPNLEELIAIDLEASRMLRVEENLQRLNLEAKLVVANAEELDSWWDNKAFDRILLDAPCSATGVIRRHPDIKLLRREDDLAKLVDIQKNLLRVLWQTLKPGGILVYATCSILPEENANLILSFLDQQHDAQALALTDVQTGDILKIGYPQAVGQQMFPQTDGHDGFYYARLRKNINT